jgi:hypothetical protein
LIRALWILAAIVIAIVTGYRSWTHRAIDRPPGVLASEPPQQRVLEGGARAFEHGEFEISPVASYRVRARLLGSKRYTNGRESEISPIDFAIGWGPMSDSAVLDHFELSQRVRYFTLHWDELPLPEKDIFESAANMHLIPADDTVRDALDRMRVGEIIELDGYLVQVKDAKGWSWRSSLSRTDRGAGACELMWVERARTT